MSAGTTLLVFVIAASAVAMGARRLRLPYTVALVLGGLGIGYLREVAPGFAEGLHLTPELLFLVFLPALLFEAAFHLNLRDFSANVRGILLLALPGVALALAITGALVHALGPLADTPVPILSALLFAAIVSATDPVSVIALFKELGAPRRLAVIMEGESLLNDGVAVVAFTAIAAVMGLRGTGEEVGALWVVRFLGWELFGGAAVGIAVGLIVSYATTWIEDHLVEITLTTIAAYGSYLLADAAHASGVIAVVAAGMCCGNVGSKHGMSPSTKIAVVSFWEYVAFAANSVVFLLIGAEIRPRELADHALFILIAWGVLVLARAAVVLIVGQLIARTKERLPARWQHLIIWGGLRGGLSMALALSLPVTFPHRALVLDLTFGVALVSILVQGLTMTPLLQWAGALVAADERRAYMKLRGSLRAAHAALRRLDAALAEREIGQASYDQLRARLAARVADLEERLEACAPFAETVRAEETRSIQARLLEAERQAVEQARDAGILTEAVARDLLDEIRNRAVAASEPKSATA